MKFEVRFTRSADGDLDHYSDMKTIDLRRGQHDLTEILSLAKSEEVLLHSQSGDDFLVERAEEFDREVAALGNSAKFMSFLENRSKESEDMSLRTVREKRGLD